MIGRRGCPVVLWVAVLSAVLVGVDGGHAQSVHDHVQGVLNETQEQLGGEVLKQIATQSGYATTGEFVAAIPPSDLMEAIGAASAGDSDGATHALTRGIAKVVAASGVKTFVFGAGAVGAGPIAVGVGAAVLTGMIIDGVRDYNQRAMQRSIADIQARYDAVNERDRYQVDHLRESIQWDTWMLDWQRTSASYQQAMARLDHRDYLGGRMTYEEYAASIARRNREMAKSVAEFHETYGDLSDRVKDRKDEFEQELEKIRQQHLELAARVTGYEPDVSAEMHALYRRYQYLHDVLQQLKAQFPDPELSIVFLVDCSGSMKDGKLQEAIAAVKQAVSGTNDGNTEWALIRFGSCNVTVVCAFTRNAGKLQAAADGLSIGGDTPLTYSIGKATSYLHDRGRGRKGRLIVLADGEDNCGERGQKGPDEAEEVVRPLYQQDRDVPMPERRY